LFVPSYLDVGARAGVAAAARFYRHVFWALAVVTSAAALLLAWAAPSVLRILAPHVPGPLGVTLLRSFSPLIVLLPLAALLAAMLQANERFVIASLRQLFWYGAALLAVAVLPAVLGPVAVPLGMVVGLALFCVVLVLTTPVSTGTGDPAALGPWFARMAAALPPIVLGSAFNYLNVAFERSIAARLPEGSLASLTYAFRLLNFPVSLVLLNATSLLFPSLARHAAAGDAEAFAGLLRRALRLAVIFGAPLAALAMALAEPAIRLVLEQGAFTAESTERTATALVWYGPSVVGIAGTHVLARAYYALHALPTLAAIGIAVIGLNVVMMPLFTVALGMRGLPLAFSTSSLVVFFVLLVVLSRRLPTLRAAALVGWMAKPVAAAAVAAAGAVLVMPYAGSGPMPLVAGIVVGVGLYTLALYAASPADVWLAASLVAAVPVRRASGA
jgi:putative peptidoglycan lipid II flippase